jgi:MarR family transcriptional regulator, negative regulator of the multidrug operon emrRAB
MHVQRDRDRSVNVIAAFALAVADAVRQAAEQSLGQGGSAPAALLTIGAYPGHTIEQLRSPLGLSQPGALRLVERLEQEGWLERRAATEGRGAVLYLTQAGQKTTARLLAARDVSLQALLDPLSDSQLADIATVAEVALTAQTHSRLDLERLCRLCHRAHCLDCPVAHAAPETP